MSPAKRSLVLLALLLPVGAAAGRAQGKRVVIDESFVVPAECAS